MQPSEKRLIPLPLIGCYLYPLSLFLVTYIITSLTKWGTTNVIFWDSFWYVSIVDGYAYNGDPGMGQNIAFFPLYPIFLKAIHLICPIPINYCTIIAASILTLFSTYFLFQIILHHYSERHAYVTILLFLTFPFSLYLFNGYSESAWLVCLLGFIFFLEVKNNIPVAVLFINMAALSRPYGIIIIILFGWHLLTTGTGRHIDPDRQLTGIKQRFYNLFFWTPLSFISLQILTVYFWIAFHDPLCFKHALHAWSRGDSLPPASRWNYAGKWMMDNINEIINRFSTAPNIVIEPHFWNLVFWFVCLIALLICLLYKPKKNLQPMIFALAFLLFFFFWFYNKGIIGINMGRHMIPIFLLPALLISRLYANLNQVGKPLLSRIGTFGLIAILSLNSLLFVIFTYRFYSNIWVS